MADIEDFKLPPHNIDAEKSVLSAIFLDNEVMFSVDSLKIEPEDFYQKEHQFVYESIKNIRSSRKTIDVVTVSDELKKLGKLDNVGGLDYLYDLSTFVITPSSAAQHAKIVKEKSILRNILKISQKIIGDVYEEKDFVEVLDLIEKKIFGLTQFNVHDSLIHIKDLLDERSTYIYEIADDPSILDKHKVLSNYESMDNLLGGFKPGEMIILAARPSMGKTSFALNLAINAATKQKKTVAIFSLEMGNDQIVDRILSSLAEIPMYKITKGDMDEEDFASLGEAMEKLGDTNIFIDDRGGATVPEIKSKLRKLVIERGNMDLVIIDYLQLMSGAGTKFEGNRVQEISEISRGLKELARELKVPIIALSQLNRSVESRPDKSPHLSDLRDSGAIEQDADSVLMLYRDDYYDPDSEEKGLADIFIRKNRNGPTGQSKLRFVKEYMRFYQVAQEGYEMED